ncbi:MAG: hypothetical protein IPJ32_02315 [Sphingobacteriaceae bacterium]|nr:hypothetical protein [Sphingobacteriaceae bacterium]
MNEAINLLFEQRFGANHIKLFESRLDLVVALLTDKDSSFKLTDEERNSGDVYSKHRNRLQSYISQILSGAGTRKVTPEFTTALAMLINKKLEGIEGVDPKELSDKIMSSLLQSPVKLPEELEEYLNDFKEASYAAVFTSRPLELEANPNEIILRIRNATVDGICNYFLENSLLKQKFKYNLPTVQLGILFWRRLAYLLIKRLKADPNNLFDLKNYIEDVRLNNPIWQNEYLHKLKVIGINVDNSNDTGDSKLKKLVDEFLTYLNEKAILEVFETKEPVFVIPHIIFNPNESTKIKGYLFLDNKTEIIEVYKYRYRDLIGWKDNVWDTVKANKKTKSIPYIESIEDTVVLNFV